MDTLNKFFMGANVADGSYIVVMRPPAPGKFTREDALNFIGWAATLLDLTDAEIQNARREIECA